MQKKLMVGWVGVVLLAGCLGGCTGSGAAARVVPAQPAAPVVVTGAVGTAGGQVAVPGGPTVDVPAGSVSGAGRIVVRRAGPGHAAPGAPSPFLSVLDAYEVSLDGARLTGPVRLTFPVLMQPLPAKAEERAAAVLGHYDAPSRSWKIVPAEYDPDHATITADVAELSWWNAFGWDFSALRNAVANRYRATLTDSASAPDCRHEDEARRGGVEIIAGDSERIRWCYGLDDGRPVLKITNVQGYPVSVTRPRAWRVPSGSSLLRRREGDTEITLLTGGSTVELYPSVLHPGGTVSLRSSNAGFVTTALDFGLETFGMTMNGVPGVPAANSGLSRRALDQVLRGDCLRGRSRGAVTGLDEAGAAALKAHAVAFECLRTAWAQQYGLAGRAGDFVGVALTWLTAGIPVLIDGVTGVPDAAIYLTPETIQVRTLAPARQLEMLG